MMIRVNFRQKIAGVISVWKDIELAVCPTLAMHFEYQEGWGLETVRSISVGSNWVEIDQYYPQFTEEELAQLEGKGWQVRRVVS